MPKVALDWDKKSATSSMTWPEAEEEASAHADVADASTQTLRSALRRPRLLRTSRLSTILRRRIL